MSMTARVPLSRLRGHGGGGGTWGGAGRRGGGAGGGGGRVGGVAAPGGGGWAVGVGGPGSARQPARAEWGAVGVVGGRARGSGRLECKGGAAAFVALIGA